MKLSLGILFFLLSCQETFTLKSKNISIHSASVSDGKLILTGQNFSSINNVSPVSANLSGYTMNIQSKSSNSLIIALTHASNNSLALAIGTVLSFTVSTATAQTQVNLTIEAAVPANAVMAFNLSSCPSGWSPLDGTGGRADARGRTLIGTGQGAGLTDRTLASVGGTETHTLTIPQMPAHTHNLRASTFGPDDPSPSGYLPTWASDYYSSTTDTLGSATTATGSGLPFPLMQPYVAFLYCQKD